MAQDPTDLPAFVVKAEELSTLNYLPASHPRPRRVEWINRGNNQKLKRGSVDMLLRTMFRDIASPSVVRLLRSTGLKLNFSSGREREGFASAFATARARDLANRSKLVTAVFRERADAEHALADLKNAGIPEGAISLMWQMNKFIDPNICWPQGHSKASVAGAVAASGIAGAALGAAILALPGIGAAAAAGAVGSAVPSVTAVSGVIGATGGAIARMISDQDVDGISASIFEQQIRQGQFFVSVDITIAEKMREVAKDILRAHGGRRGPGL